MCSSWRLSLTACRPSARSSQRFSRTSWALGNNVVQLVEALTNRLEALGNEAQLGEVFANRQEALGNKDVLLLEVCTNRLDALGAQLV